MDNKIAGSPVYTEEFNSLMEKLKERDNFKKMTDKELANAVYALNEELIRREVVRRIEQLANHLK